MIIHVLPNFLLLPLLHLSKSSLLLNDTSAYDLPRGDPPPTERDSGLSIISPLSRDQISFPGGSTAPSSRGYSSLKTYPPAVPSLLPSQSSELTLPRQQQPRFFESSPELLPNHHISSSLKFPLTLTRSLPLFSVTFHFPTLFTLRKVSVSTFHSPLPSSLPSRSRRSKNVGLELRFPS